MVKTVLPMLLIFLAAAFGETLQNDSITVHVKIEGFKSENGLCWLLLFENKKGFPDSTGDAALMLSGKIREKSAEFSFKVRPGMYAISVLHDENSNRQMDKTWYGKPTEGIGSSNNPKVGSSPPKFEESAVNLDGNNTHLRIRLSYF
jgi:uncharacterized protein (DUF2141 family)